MIIHYLLFVLEPYYDSISPLLKAVTFEILRADGYDRRKTVYGKFTKISCTLAWVGG